MWLVFLLLVLLIGFIFSKVQIDLYEIYVKEKDYNFKILISLKLFGLFKIFSIKLDRFGIKIFNKKININKLKLKKIDIRSFDLLKSLDINLNKVNFNLKIGLIDIGLTNLAIVVFSSIFPIFIKDRIREDKVKYEVLPEYNKFYVSFLGNFSVTIKFLTLIKNINSGFTHNKNKNGVKESLKYE